jgi:hypothetical protein
VRFSAADVDGLLTPSVNISASKGDESDETVLFGDGKAFHGRVRWTASWIKPGRNTSILGSG